MSELAAEAPAPARAPWHLWAVGILAILWNGAGAYVILSAQQGGLAESNPSEAAYYAVQATWFVVVTDIALFAAIAGGLALLLRSRLAVPLFAISLVAIAVTAAYDFAMGTTQMFNNTGTVVATLLIWVLAVFQLWYAAMMRKRGILR